MKTVIDANIPFVETPLRRVGSVEARKGTEITRDTLADADILLTRTRTRCNRDLLEGTPVGFIGTATIGTDHIDLDYCREAGIEVVNAPGCNAPAVAQWVLAAIALTLNPGETLAHRTLGVIGAGNVGRILIRWAEGLGMRVLVCDPPLQEAGDTSFDYRPLSDLAAECDTITVHTPYTTSGPHPTHHLLGGEFIATLRRSPMLLNASRGPVADTEALKEGLRSGAVSSVAIDCWEHEPEIDRELLDMALVATPHIAGYSREGKVRASQMVLDALSQRLGGEFTQSPLIASAPIPLPVPETITADMLRYDILADTNRLKSTPSTFEDQRNNYHLRPEPGQEG